MFDIFLPWGRKPFPWMSPLMLVLGASIAVLLGWRLLDGSAPATTTYLMVATYAIAVAVNYQRFR